MKSQKLRSSKKFRKRNILFISNDFNYFVDNNGSFYRMYQNLIYFHNHKDFKAFVLQSDRDRNLEKKDLKKDIECYYYKPLKILRNNFIHFLDFNPFFITKIIKILKKHKIDLIHFDYVYGINIMRFLTKIPISYNAFNVEYLYYKKVGSYYRKIPSFLRSVYTLYIYLLEKNALKFVKNINAFSLDDKKEFLKIYKIPERKIHVNTMGYIKDIYFNNIEKGIARKKLNIDAKKFVIIFHGFYQINIANKDAIDLIRNKIAPRIKDKDVLFLIAGKMPKFKNTDNLKFIGYVDDLRYFLYAADIAIVPILRGSGIRIKMIDYLSARLPMITTKKAAMGLVFEDKKHGLIVNDEDIVNEFLKKIMFLKENPKKINEFRSNIEVLLNNYYKWNKILESLAKKYRIILK